MATCLRKNEILKLDNSVLVLFCLLSQVLLPCSEVCDVLLNKSRLFVVLIVTALMELWTGLNLWMFLEWILNTGLGGKDSSKSG